MATLSENNNNQADFNSDQAAILQDLARNGAADEAHMYGYGEANLQSNGANPSVDFTFSAAYPSTGLSNSFQDMEDPAALLESLASFEHPPPSNEGPTPGSNDHFESLLQAVERAEGQAGPPKEHGQTGRNSTPRRTEQYGFSQKSPLNENRSKRRRDEDEDDGRTFGFIKTSRSNKRQKQSVQDEDEEQLAKEREIWGPEENDEQDGSTTFEYQHSPIATADARAVGVHSAAALFRRPSTASKKYTRPPMSKLFTSLELTPEQFLHLQAAAKTYMLDENYPERAECVGSRGKGDTDMVKLKLFGCVKSFLEDEGWGEKCFGEHAQGAENRKLKWPQMKNKVISLVTPLLRRMVTNERQRQYAIETRKGNTQTKGGTKRQLDSETPKRATPQPASKEHQSQPSPYRELDPKLNQYHYNLESAFPTENGQAANAVQTTIGMVSDPHLSAGASDDGEVKYQVNILQNGRRIKPTVTLTPASCPGFPSLVQYIHGLIDDEAHRPGSIKVLLPNGLIDVGSEESWMEAVETVKENVWMDGVVKCVVQVEEK